MSSKIHQELINQCISDASMKHVKLLVMNFDTAASSRLFVQMSKLSHAHAGNRSDKRETFPRVCTLNLEFIVWTATYHPCLLLSNHESCCEQEVCCQALYRTDNNLKPWNSFCDLDHWPWSIVTFLYLPIPFSKSPMNNEKNVEEKIQALTFICQPDRQTGQ